MSISDLTIQHLGPKGDGLGSGTRGRVFVERTAPGDRVKADVFRDSEGVARGEVLKILEPSPYRQKAPCLHYDRCGSCTLQHLTPNFYRRWKTELVKEAFVKQGLRPRAWLEPIFLGSQNRRRATFNAVKNRGRVILGYYRRRSDEITDINSCLVADPKLLGLRATILPFLASLLIDGEPTDIFLQIVGDSIDMVISGPIGRHGEPDAAVRATLEELVENSQITRISWRDYETDEIHILVHRGPVTAEFGPLKINLPPAAFLQPTVEGEAALVNAVMSALPPRGHFADMFAGCGTFSGPMLTRGSVDAYETVPRSVSALAKSAGKYPLRVFRRDLFRTPLRRDELNRFDAIVFDPPRAGCPELATAMAHSKTRTLVGVSCNPATFARDAAILCEGGYWLQSLQVIDQFLWSHHVEIVGVFTKGKRQ